MSGLSITYISNVENGRGNSTLAALEALAGLLQQPVTGLVASAMRQFAGCASCCSLDWPRLARL